MKKFAHMRLIQNYPHEKGYNGVVTVFDDLANKEYRVAYQYRALTYTTRVINNEGLDHLIQKRIKDFARQILKDMYIQINLDEFIKERKQRRVERRKPKNKKRYNKANFTRDKK